MKVNVFDRFVILTLLVIILFTGPIIDSTVSFITGILLLILLIIRVRKTSSNEFLLILPLIIIVLTGILGALLNNRFVSGSDLYLTGKDTWYFIKPVIFLLIGSLLYRTGLSKENLISLVIGVAMITAVYHIIRVITYISFINHDYILDTLKTHTSFTSVLEAFSLGFVISRKRYSDISKNVRLKRWLIISILILSIFLSFSRTVVVAFVISLLSLADFFSFRLKVLLRTVLGLTAVTASGYLLLVLINTSSVQNSNLNLFTTKFLNSLNELTFKRETASFKEINQNWRGYESNLARKEINKGNIMDKLIGFGFGKTVFIGYSGFLGPENINIPIFHNGFVQVRLKSGYLGLLLFIGFFLMGFLIADRKFPFNDYDNFLKGMLLTAFLSTLVITGIYNKTVFDPVCVLIGFFIALNLNLNEHGSGVVETNEPLKN